MVSRSLVQCLYRKTDKTITKWQAATMVEIPDTFAAIHSVKTDTHVSASNTICDTHTLSACLPYSTAFPTPGGNLKSKSYSGRSREEEVTIYASLQNTQAKWCLTLAWKRGIKHCWNMGSSIWNWERDIVTDRETERVVWKAVKR